MVITQNLRKEFRIVPINPFKKAVRVTALRDVTLSVHAGEAVALVGRNGAGKTTLLKVLSTLVLADAGGAQVCGYDVAKQPVEVRRRIGLVTGDERSLYWRLTGRQNLTFFGALHNIPAGELPDRVDGMLKNFGLSEHADAAVRTYSSGMRQRLSLARGMLHEPEVLFMDEPCKSVDPSIQLRFVEKIREEIVAEKGCAVLFATHDLEEALALGGSVAVIEKGTIVYFGRPGGAAELRDMITGFSGEEDGRRQRPAE